MINILLLLKFLCLFLYAAFRYFKGSVWEFLVHCTHDQHRGFLLWLRKKCEITSEATQRKKYKIIFSFIFRKTNRKFIRSLDVYTETEDKIFIRMRKVIKKVMFYYHYIYFFALSHLFHLTGTYRSHLIFSNDSCFCFIIVAI